MDLEKAEETETTRILFSVDIVCVGQSKLLIDYLFLVLESKINGKYANFLSQNIFDSSDRSSYKVKGLDAFEELSNFLFDLGEKIPDVNIITWVYNSEYRALVSEASSLEDLVIDIESEEDYAWLSYCYKDVVVVPDLENTSNSSYNDSFTHLDSYLLRGWKSAEYHPIVISGEPRGVVGFFAFNRGFIHPSYKLFLRSIIRHVVGRIVELDYFTQALRKAERLKKFMPAMTLVRESSQRIHDIRDDMNSLRGVIWKIKGTASSRSIISIDNQCLKGLSLLDDIGSTLSKQLKTFRSARDKRKKTDICKFIRDLDSKFRFLAHEKEVEYKVSVPEDPLFCRIQRFYLARAVENIISNGIYFSKQNMALTIRSPYVELKVKETESEVIIEITDSGPSIQQEPIDKIFEEGETTKADGYGIGLTITKSVVEEHGGGIIVSNRNQGGACFQICLPKY